MGGFGILGFLFVFVIVVLVYFEVLGLVFGYLELEAISNYNVFEVYVEDGVLLGKYYVENCINVDFEEIFFDLINVFVVIEDVCFFEYSGIDVWVVAWVLVKLILLMDEFFGGGSILS